jgi:UDP-2,3-diacylglucosamine hydrolase
MTEPVGLIAGNGRFPLLFAEAARRQGVPVVAVAHQGETPEALAALVGEVTWVRVGELGKIIRVLKQAGVRRAVMAGGITKPRQLADFRPDLRGAAFLARTRSLKDDVLLRGVADELERDGITVVSSTLFLGALVPEAGVLTRREPRAREWEDVRFGFRVAKDIGRWDIGQSVVVKQGAVLAVEGIEGTDAAIRRGGTIGHGDVVVVKVSKPTQDLRFDVPAVGPTTIDVLCEVGGRVLALEAGRTIVIDRDQAVAAADRGGVAIVALASVDA